MSLQNRRKKQIPASRDRSGASSLFRYRSKDTKHGVTKHTALQLAEQLGLNETQLLHQLLADAAARELPQYEPDDGPFTEEQWQVVRRSRPAKLGRLRASLLD